MRKPHRGGEEWQCVLGERKKSHTHEAELVILSKIQQFPSGYQKRDLEKVQVDFHLDRGKE